MLFGSFSIADAFYAPVVTRFATYGVKLSPLLEAYSENVLALPPCNSGSQRPRQNPKR
jgi:glutathione S-transferase